MQAIKTLKTAIVGENSENFLRYDDSSVEKIQEGEEEKVSDIIASFRSMHEKNFEKHRHGFRGTHSKTEGLVNPSLLFSFWNFIAVQGSAWTHHRKLQKTDSFVLSKLFICVL